MSLSSGSSGNSVYIGNAHTNLLVDAGISAKRIECGLNEMGLNAADLDGILITHEHSDHINGLKVLSKRYSLPIYATRGTIGAIMGSPSGEGIREELFSEVRADEDFVLKDLCISPIAISHDAAEPVAYRFDSMDRREAYAAGLSDLMNQGLMSAAVCTDLGIYDDYLLCRLKGVSTILIEANHDVNMLEAGRYPYRLKQRILGEKGHLSNESAGELLKELYSDRLRAVLLGHLSHENNLAELAYETVRLSLSMSGKAPEKTGMKLTVAPRDGKSVMVEI